MNITAPSKDLTLADAYEQENSFTDPHSNVFVSRFGDIYRISDHEQFHERSGVFFVAKAHGHILLNCPPWATNWAELTGGGLKPYETEWDALNREIKEEIGLNIPPQQLEELNQTKDIYFMNLYAEDLENMPDRTPFLRYKQIFFHMDISHLISENTLDQPLYGEDGSYGFWQNMHHLYPLPMRQDNGEQIEGLRIGHQHVIIKAIKESL